MQQRWMKKEILVVEDDQTPVEDQRNKIIVLQEPSRRNIGIFPKPELDITAFDHGADICWSIWTHSRLYTIFDKASRTFVDLKTKEAFLEKIKENYPEDFDFFLWHPEIFSGKWNNS